MEAATPIPALRPVLRALEGACIVVVADDGGMDVGRVGELVEDVDVDTDADTDADAEDVEDGVMLLLVDEVAEDDVIEPDAVCPLKDSGEGA